MGIYKAELAKNLHERIAYFNNADMSEEARLLKARLNSIESKPVEKPEIAPCENVVFINPFTEMIRENLKAKLAEEICAIPKFEKQYILENADKARTLKELQYARIAYIERMLKISHANNSEKIAFAQESNTETGPYNNEKIFNEAMQLIYSQDPLWTEDLKELYFSIMPISSAQAVSKSPL